MRMASSK